MYPGIFLESLADFQCVFSSGIAVAFRTTWREGQVGYLIHGNSPPTLPNLPNRKYNIPGIEFEIWIDTVPKSYRWVRKTRSPWNTSLLEEQQTVLFHELIHAFNKKQGFESKGRYERDGIIEHFKYEELIDKDAYLLVQDKELAEQVIVEMCGRVNCIFVYEPGTENTPFFNFHMDILRKKRAGLAVIVPPVQIP